MPHFDSSEQLNRYVAERSGGVCLLSFSGGKDSVASWLHLQRSFSRVIPVYLYLVPRLSFVEESLRYFEEQFGTHILRLPHPSLYRMLNSFVFQPPENCAAIESLQLPEYDYDDAFEVAKDIYDVPGCYTAIGVRATDSLNRWASIKQHGPLNEKRKTFYPIYDWSKDRLIAEIKRSGLKLPKAEYEMFGRSFDGLDVRFLKPIRDRYPEDFTRILEFFPLADIELARHEYREAYYG